MRFKYYFFLLIGFFLACAEMPNERTFFDMTLNKLITIRKGSVDLYRFSTPNSDLKWKIQIKSSEPFLTKNYSSFYSVDRQFRLTSSYGISDNYLISSFDFGEKSDSLIFLYSLGSSESLEEAMEKWMDKKYKGRVGAIHTHWYKKNDIFCVEANAEYNYSYSYNVSGYVSTMNKKRNIFSSICPVFFRSTFALNNMSLIIDYDSSDFLNSYELNNLYVDFQHLKDTLEFIEPPSQKIPEGFSLDEQFKRIQEPNWQL